MENLTRNVVRGGYCVGCGACAVNPTNGITMEMNREGAYVAVLPAAPVPAAAKICPFTAATNEDEIAAAIFDRDGAIPRHDGIGAYLSCFAGHVAEDSFRIMGSSGGLGSWIACQLLAAGDVDAVIHVAATKGLPYFGYKISGSVEEVRDGAKSRYHPIEMSAVMKQVKADRRRYLFVGLPCFVKALRLMQIEDGDLRERIPFTMGLVCGHLKTAGFADFYARSLGQSPEEVRDIDFRRKISANKVNDYGVSLTLTGGHVVEGENRHIWGTSWGYGLFKYSACDYCDDVLAETADVTIGDAWLPRYETEWCGTNIVVARTPRMLSLLRGGLRDGALSLDRIEPGDVVRSQASGLRHRRQGLSYRLWLKERAGRWHPRKRVKASDCAELGPAFRDVQRARIRLAVWSRRCFVLVSGPMSFRIFKFAMRLLVMRYHNAGRGVAEILKSHLARSRGS